MMESNPNSIVALDFDKAFYFGDVGKLENYINNNVIMRLLLNKTANIRIIEY